MYARLYLAQAVTCIGLLAFCNTAFAQTTAETDTNSVTTREAPSSSNIPAGFEAFLQEQTTLVDVHFGGRYVYSGLATFDQSTITFNDPEAVLESIPGLTNPAELLRKLSGPMPNNEQLKCVVAYQSNCGSIETESIDLIFDPANYQVTFFVAAEYLSLQLQQVSKFLPESSAGLSLLQTLNITATGNDRSNELQQNINGRTLVALGGSNLHLTSNYSEDGGYEVDDLTWQRDVAGKRYIAGLLSNDRENLNFSNQFDLIGLSVGTNLSTREDLRLTTGNRIEIFLPTRSRVSIYKDSRLFSTEILDAGNQELDTSSLPGGSYEVDLRIDDGSGERSETRFYSKNSRLPPADAPQYSLTIGRLRDAGQGSIVSTTDISVVSGSYERRTGDNSAMHFGALAVPDSGLFEAGWFQATPAFEIDLSGSITSDNDFGLSTDIVTSLFQATLSINYRQIWNDNLAPVYNEANLLGETSRQISANMSLPIFSGGMSLSARLNRRETEDLKTYSLNYRFAPFQFEGKTSLSPRFQFSQQNGENTFLFTMTFQTNRGNWRISQSSEYQNQESAIGTEESVPLRVAANWSSPETWKSLAQIGFNANRQSDEQASLGANLDWRGSFGKAVLNLDQNLTGSDKLLSWGGSYHTSFVVADSAVAFGGRVQNNAALLIDLREVEADDVYFEVLVDNRSRGIAEPGSTSLITLPSYETYEVRLEARGLGFVSMIDKTERVTLYPGNAVRLPWEIEQIDIVFGKLLDEQNQPIAGALIRGVNGLSVTDDQGNFQGELSSTVDELIAETRTHTCTLLVPEYQAKQGIAFLGDLQCVLSSKTESGATVVDRPTIEPRAVEPAASIPDAVSSISVAPTSSTAPTSGGIGLQTSNCPSGSLVRVIQLMSFPTLQTAQSILGELQLSAGFVEQYIPDNGQPTAYRVIAGPYQESKMELADASAELETKTGSKPWIKEKDCADLRRVD